MKNLIWSEDFRPDKLSSMVLTRETRNAFKKFIKEKQIPHILLYGSPGSGKTTLSMILLKEIAAGKLILNASSEDRGIATIKNKVKQFASTYRGNKDKLNIVFMDEADGLTADAQLALKNTIETYHKNCRFIFTCNQIDKIIDPIVSRCMLFKFNTLPKDKLLRFLEKIMKEESIKYKTRDIDKLIDIHYPDIRTIINMLQMYSVNNKLNVPDVSGNLKLFRKYLLAGKLFKIREMFSGMMDFVWVYKYLFNIFIPEYMKAEVQAEAAIVVAEYLYRDRTVVDKEINCTAVCLEIMNLLEVDISFNK